MAVDKDRVWPVTLDPALEQIGNDSATVDYTVAELVIRTSPMRRIRQRLQTTLTTSKSYSSTPGAIRSLFMTARDGHRRQTILGLCPV